MSTNVPPLRVIIVDIVWIFPEITIVPVVMDTLETPVTQVGYVQKKQMKKKYECND